MTEMNKKNGCHTFDQICLQLRLTLEGLTPLDFARESNSDGSHDEVRRMTKSDGRDIHLSSVRTKIKDKNETNDKAEKGETQH